MNYTLKNFKIPTEAECGADYQTYCKINGQTIADNMTFTYDYPVIAGNTYNLAAIWNEIQDAIKVIGNFGTKGTKLDVSDLIVNKQKNEYTTLNYYNNLLKKLKQSAKPSGEYIKALDISNLKKYINDYEISSDLCPICNNSCMYCNSGLGCGSECDSEGGGGCAHDPNCCQAGNWGSGCPGIQSRY